MGRLGEPWELCPPTAASGSRDLRGGRSHRLWCACPSCPRSAVPPSPGPGAGGFSSLPFAAVSASLAVRQEPVFSTPSPWGLGLI